MLRFVMYKRSIEQSTLVGSYRTWRYRDRQTRGHRTGDRRIRGYRSICRRCRGRRTRGHQF